VSKNSTKRQHAIFFDKKEGLTHQSFKDECDVNNIVRMYTETGMVNHLPRTQPQYADAPEIDYFEAARVQADLRSQQEAGTLDLEEVLNPAEPEETEEKKASPEAPEEPSKDPEATTLDGA